MIYDCFLFYNELELLDIRLNTLDSVVDKFVLVEATVTHTNKPKPLFYQENKAKFKKFHKKIIHVVVKDTPNVSLPWIIERFQFEAAIRGLRYCKPNDIILHGPVDEIPKPEAILKWKDKSGKLKAFNMHLSLFYLNFFEYTKGGILGTRMFKFKDLKSFENIYFTRYYEPNIVITDGGWHFSYIGGIKRVQQKLASTVHQELNNDRFNTPEHILLSSTQGKDPFGMGWRFKIVDISKLPTYVSKNQKKFAKILINHNKLQKRLFAFYPLIFNVLKLLRINVFRKLKRT